MPDAVPRNDRLAHSAGYPRAGINILGGDHHISIARFVLLPGGTMVRRRTAVSIAGVGRSSIDDFFRTNVRVGKLVQSLGLQPGSDNGQAAALQTVAKTADSLGVTVNPRYGAWDAKKAVIGAASEPWVVNKSQTAA